MPHDTASLDWYFADDGGQVGPLTMSQMQEIIRLGRIQRETLVWAPGAPNWTAAGNSPLRNLFTVTAPPPLPTAPSYDGPPGAHQPLAGSGSYAGRSLSFLEAPAAVLGKYATFSGRARPSELWWFMAFVVLTSIVAMIADAAIFGNPNVQPITGIFSLAIILPCLAVQVRRLHDTDRSGWTILLSLIPIVGGIILLIMLCEKGTAGPNRFD